MQKVVIIVGPTSSGKTALSIELAKAINGEVVSADSRQVYRGMDLGTGKVTREEMEEIPHHLIDVASPQETFSAALYVEKARAAISEIAARGHVPLIVGGTGFYIDALLGTVQLPEVAPDKALRLQLSAYSLQALQEELKRIDPERYEKIDTKNPRRLIRAIEIAHAQESFPKTKSSQLEARSSYNVLWLGVTLSKEELAKKISTRLAARMEAGMLEEIQQLHTEGLSYERMEEFGLEYRYVSRYLTEALTQEEMLIQLDQEIRNYAKRQMTWFKKNKEIHWFNPNDTNAITLLVREFLQKN